MTGIADWRGRRVITIFKRAESSRAIWLVTLLTVAAPATADGGISAIGGMLPVFIVIWSIGAGLAVWFFLGVYVLLASPAGEQALKSFRILATTLVVVTLVAALIGSAFLSILVFFAALVVAMIVGGISALVLSLSGRGKS